MRQGIWASVACALACAPSAAAQSAPAPAQDAPAVLRRTRFEVDCRPQTLQTRRRGALFVVLHAIARIAAHVRRG
jgi:hypothetical protein